MIAARYFLGALVFTIGFCVLGPVLDGPSDTQTAQAVASDKKAAIKTASTQLARDTAACHQHYGPNAQIRMLDGVHLVCRPPLSGPATTTAQVQP